MKPRRVAWVGENQASSLMAARTTRRARYKPFPLDRRSLGPSGFDPDSERRFAQRETARRACRLIRTFASRLRERVTHRERKMEKERKKERRAMRAAEASQTITLRAARGRKTIQDPFLSARLCLRTRKLLLFMTETFALARFASSSLRRLR